MRLIDADELLNKRVYSCKNGNFPYKKAYENLISDIKSSTTVDAKPIGYQTMSKNFAMLITKAIVERLSGLHLDLPSFICEIIESKLLKGKFADVENFVQSYIKNHCGEKTDEEAKYE